MLLVFHMISCGSVSLPSFASVLRDVINGKKSPQPDIQDKIPQQKVIDSIIQADNMWINYYGPPGTFQYFSVADILDSQWPPSFFADKIILVEQLNGFPL